MRPNWIFNMMIFIAERVSNKDFIQLERDVRRIVSALEKAGHKSKCTFIDYADNPKKFDGWNENWRVSQKEV